MKLSKIVNAVGALSEISKRSFPVGIAYKFAKVSKALLDGADFFDREKMKIVAEFGVTEGGDIPGEAKARGLTSFWRSSSSFPRLTR